MMQRSCTDTASCAPSVMVSAQPMSRGESASRTLSGAVTMCANSVIGYLRGSSLTDERRRVRIQLGESSGYNLILLAHWVLREGNPNYLFA